MTPQELARMDRLEKLVQSLVRVENVPFIKNAERRLAVAGITSETPGVATTILKTVNEAGASTYSVAKLYDAKVEITLSDGSTRFIGVYNS